MNKNESKDVWVVWTNTDLTEGCGVKYAKHYCTLGATAIRLAKGGYVQGLDCPVTMVKAYFMDNGSWYVPGAWINPGTPEDAEQEEILKAKREAERLKSHALARARELGMTDEEIAALSS